VLREIAGASFLPLFLPTCCPQFLPLFHSPREASLPYVPHFSVDSNVRGWIVFQIHNYGWRGFPSLVMTRALFFFFPRNSSRYYSFTSSCCPPRLGNPGSRGVRNCISLAILFPLSIFLHSPLFFPPPGFFFFFHFLRRFIFAIKFSSHPAERIA